MAKIKRLISDSSEKPVAAVVETKSSENYIVILSEKAQVNQDALKNYAGKKYLQKYPSADLE